MVPNLIGGQVVLFRERWSDMAEEIREHWDLDYVITDIDYLEGCWAVVMSEVYNWYGQSCFRSSEFPQDKIQEAWDEGRYITSIAYSGSYWVVVTTRVEDCSAQAYVVGSWSHCLSEVENLWEKKAYVTSIACDGDFYVFVCSKFGRSFSQRIKSYSRPRGANQILGTCAEDEMIVDLFDMNGDLTVVTSSGMLYSKQGVCISSSISELRLDIKSNWSSGYKITTIAYYGGRYIAVVTK
jgi:hypothetical protein